MKKNFLLLALLFAILTCQGQYYADFLTAKKHIPLVTAPHNVMGVVMDPILGYDFNDDLVPDGWTAYTEYGMDFIYPYEGVFYFFRQGTGDENMIFSTQSLDLSNYSKISFDLNEGNSNTPTTIQVGLMSNPTDPSTFQLIDQFTSTPYTWETKELVIKAFPVTSHIAFKAISGYFGYMGFDNVVFYDDIIVNNKPANLTNLQMVTGTQGEMDVTLSWNNPTLEQDGNDLTNLDSLVIYANGTRVKTILDPVIGGYQSEIITVPVSDFYTFTLIPYNLYGQGFTAGTNKKWIGLDYPSTVNNLSLVKFDNSAQLSWTAPVAGANGGYFDGVILQYKITRADSVITFVDGQTTTFSEEVTADGTFAYTVEAINVVGTGLPFISNSAYFNTSDYLYFDNFWANPFGEGMWTESSDFWLWYPINNSGGDVGEILFIPYTYEQTTTRLISPVINTSGKTALTMEFRKLLNTYANPFMFSIATTSDGGITWNSVYEWEVASQIGPDVSLKVIANEDVGSADFQFAFVFEGYTPDVMVIAVDKVRLYTATSVDLNLVETNLIKAEPDQVVNPEVIIENLGSELTPANITMKINNGTEEVFTSTKQADISIGGIQTIAMDEWTAAEGEYTIYVEITCVGDVDLTNNSKTSKYNVYYLTDKDIVVAEEGTGTWCTYCPGAAMGLEELVNEGKKLAVIAYHSGDNYDIPKGRSKLNFYEIPGFPTVFFDGTTELSGGDHYNSLADWYRPYVDSLVNVKTPVKVTTISGTIDGNNLSADIRVNSLSPIKDPFVKLYAVITESDIDEEWQDQTKLNFVARAMLTDTLGDAIDLSGKEDNIHLSTTLDPSCNLSKCKLIVFVQNTETKEVFNADMDDLSTLSVTETGFSSELNIYPNPSTEYFKIISDKPIEHVDIFNSIGQLIDSKQVNSQNCFINVMEFPAGLYFVRVKTTEGDILRKLTVK